MSETEFIKLYKNHPLTQKYFEGMSEWAENVGVINPSILSEIRFLRFLKNDLNSSKSNNLLTSPTKLIPNFSNRNHNPFTNLSPTDPNNISQGPNIIITPSSISGSPYFYKRYLG